MLNKYLLTGALLAGSSLMAYAQQGNTVIQPISQSIAAFEPFTIYVSNTTDLPEISIFSQKINRDEIVITYSHERNGSIPFPGFPDPEIPPFIALTTINGLPAGTYSLKTKSLPYGYEALVLEDEIELVIADAPEAIDVYGLFDTWFKNYFITADVAERDRLLAERPPYSYESALWGEVDNGFKVWPSEGPAPSAARPVCRLYSSIVFSHYYTIDEEECTLLVASGWEHQGIGFKAIPAVANSCPLGTLPVWRLYQDRPDSFRMNHRFTTDTITYQSMIHQGWTGEGVAFCSPE